VTAPDDGDGSAAAPGGPDATDEPGAAPAAPDDPDAPGGMERRTLVRLLVALAIGVPLVVEGGTLLGLLDRAFGGGNGDEEGSGGNGSPTGTPTRRAVGVGDELLPETTPVEEVTDMTLRATGDGWRFELTAEVRNDLDTAYEFRLGAVSTDDRTVEGGAGTGTMASGETATITGRWDLPEGEAPEAVAVSAVVAVVGGDTPREVSARVPLERVAVQG